MDNTACCNQASIQIQVLCDGYLCICHLTSNDRALVHSSALNTMQEKSAGYPNTQGACLSLDTPTVLSQDNAGASSPVLICSKQQVQIF